jgi:DNA-directed RNA polymerase beta' subunit
MRRNKDDRTQSVELLADALKLDIATVDSEIPDGSTPTKPIKPTDLTKFFKFGGIILALVVFIGGISWLMSNSKQKTSDELEQTEELLSNDTIVSNKDSISQPAKEAEKKQETKQTISPTEQQAADHGAPAPIQSGSNANAKMVSSAKNIAEMRSLANQNIPESYAPLSKMEFDEGNYDAAAKYAQMAQNSGHATNASRKVLQELANMGY